MIAARQLRLRFRKATTCADHIAVANALADHAEVMESWVRMLRAAVHAALPTVNENDAVAFRFLLSSTADVQPAKPPRLGRATRRGTK